ncbi:MAG: hypothetical protein DMF77_13560, partial [Acidobacteria bacterium]
MGLLAKNGTGVAKDIARAASLFKESCEGHFGGGCYELATAYFGGRGLARDFSQAAT